MTQSSRQPTTYKLASFRPSRLQSRQLTASRWPPGTLRGRPHDAAVSTGSSLDAGWCEMGAEEEDGWAEAMSDRRSRREAGDAKELAGRS